MRDIFKKNFKKIKSLNPSRNKKQKVLSNSQKNSRGTIFDFRRASSSNKPSSLIKSKNPSTVKIGEML